MSRVQGIDISKWQGRKNPDGSWTATIDWQKVADSGVKFVYIRAAYGADYVDPLFQVHWDGAKSVGLLRGAYHFCRPKQSITDHIDIMVNTVPDDDRGELPPWYDLEHPPGDPIIKGKPLVEFSNAYMLGVEAEWGRRMDIYTGYYFWQSNLRVNFKYPDWPNYRQLALAQYPSGPPSNPWLIPSGWDDWTIWQYSSKGVIPGISGNVDMDFFNGSYEDLLAYAGQPVPPSSPLEERVTILESQVSDISKWITSWKND